MFTRFLSTAVIAASAVFMAATTQAEELTIHGSTTVEANLFMPHKAALEEKTGLTLNVVGNGSSRGITGVDGGGADVGMISASLESMLTKLKMTDRASEFVGSPVGETRAVFATHPSNPVKALTKDQVIAILKGETKNWSEVGGNDMPIVVVTEYSGGGIRSTIEKKLLGKTAISAPSLREMQNAPQIRLIASQLPNAFATASIPMVKEGGINRIETDAEIAQPLVLVTKGAPNANAQKLIDEAKAILN